MCMYIYIGDLCISIHMRCNSHGYVLVYAKSTRSYRNAYVNTNANASFVHTIPGRTRSHVNHADLPDNSNAEQSHVQALLRAAVAVLQSLLMLLRVLLSWMP